MSDPVPAVSESDATGETAEIFADIRQVYRVGVVNLIWRHLATFPGALRWVWDSVRPLYVDGTIEREAAVLRASIVAPELPAIPAAAFAGVGLGKADLDQIRAVLAAYDRTNAMALVALSAVEGRITEPIENLRDAGAAYTSLPTPVQHELQLPKLLDLEEMSPATAELVLALNRIGASNDAPVLASMYRHLAHWPAYLALAWAMVASLESNDRLDTAIVDVLGKARASGRRLATRLPAPWPSLGPAVRADISQALARFTSDVIAKMVVICALLRRLTPTTHDGG
jgi:hypothetical protein